MTESKHQIRAERREKVARIIDPWSLKQCEWAVAADDDAVLKSFLPARNLAYARADAIEALYAPTGDENGVLHSQPCDGASAIAEVSMGQQPEPSAWRPTHRHIGRGTDYEYLGWGRAQCSPSGLLDDEHVAIYRGEDGSLWARRLAEFNDGRFEPLPTPPVEGEGS